jgi:hypothetical protein
MILQPHRFSDTDGGAGHFRSRLCQPRLESPDEARNRAER